jgi:hypothetical protein
MTRPAPSLLLLATLLAGVTACSGPPGSGGADDPGLPAVQALGGGWITPPDSLLPRVVDALSEPGGFFDTDNLISNEASYLHAVSALRRRNVRGGAFIGVGPDQNFSYITAVRPEVAFIVDIRRDNLLLLLLLRAMLEESGTRGEYLALLFGRPVPVEPEAWRDRPLPELLDWIESLDPDTAAIAGRRLRLHERVTGYGVPVSVDDRATLDRFHEEFIRSGPRLRYNTLGRPPAPWYPTYRELLLETDLEGTPSSYLVADEPFQFLRDLHRRNGVIPVVGDLAGPHAVRAIGAYLAARGLRVSACYVSNVEFYLWRGGSFEAFVENLAALPSTEETVLIRSAFVRTLGIRHPRGRPGYASVQLVQPMEEFVRSARGGAYRSYLDVVSAGEG